MKKTIILLLFGSLIASGCGTTEWLWHPTNSYEEVQKDFKDCQNIVAEYERKEKSKPLKERISASWFELFEGPIYTIWNCMWEKGYKSVPKKEALYREGLYLDPEKPSDPPIIIYRGRELK
jgi:hypothetical protein